jgi:hypothetical protein
MMQESLVDKMKPISDNFNAKKLIVNYKKEVPNVGLMWSINLKDNGLSPYRKYWRNLMHTLVKEVDNEVYEVTGIESFATAEAYEHESIALRVKKIIYDK